MRQVHSILEKVERDRDRLLRMVRQKERKRAFLENGSVLLEKLIAYCNGRPIPIRSFSTEELERATNNFDPCCVFYEEWLYKWYKGSFEGRIISVKSITRIWKSWNLSSLIQLFQQK